MNHKQPKKVGEFSSYPVFIGCQKLYLKGQGNEADFLEFLHKPVWHRSLTLHFKPFRFWLQIPQLAESGSRQDFPIDTIFFKPLNKSMVIVHYIPGFYFAKLIY